MYDIYDAEDALYTSCRYHNLYITSEALLDYMDAAGWRAVNDDYHIEHAMDAFEQHLERALSFFPDDDVRLHLTNKGFIHIDCFVDLEERLMEAIFEDFDAIVREFRYYGQRYDLLAA